MAARNAGRSISMILRKNSGGVQFQLVAEKQLEWPWVIQFVMISRDLLEMRKWKLVGLFSPFRCLKAIKTVTAFLQTD